MGQITKFQVSTLGVFAEFSRRKLLRDNELQETCKIPYFLNLDSPIKSEHGAEPQFALSQSEARPLPYALRHGLGEQYGRVVYTIKKGGC